MPAALGVPATTVAVDDGRARRANAAPPGFTVAVMASALLVHLPGFARQLYDSDEAAIATLGSAVVHGGVLYQDAIDRKPPLAPLVYAASFFVTGSHDLRPLHLLVALELGVAALVLAAEARRVAGPGHPAAGWWAAGLLVAGAVATSPSASQAANYSQLALLPGVVAIVAARRGTSGSALLAGVALGAAVLTRQTWAIGLGPAAFAVWWTGGRRWSRPALLSGATVGTVLAPALVLPLGPFLHWTFTANTGLLDLSASTNVAGRLWGSLWLFVWCHAAAIALALRRPGAGDRRWPRHPDLWLWLAAGVAAVLAGFRFFDHYWFQVLPALALLGAIGAARARLRLPVLLALAALLPAVVQWRAAWTTTRFTRDWSPLVAAVDAWSSPGAPVMVWGSAPEIYWLSGRDPGGALVLSDFVVERNAGRPDGPERLADATPGALDDLMTSLAHRPPTVILDTSTADLRKYGNYPLTLVPPVAAFVASYYQPREVVEGVTVYVLVQTPIPDDVPDVP